jgi:glycosyl hydrolase family 2
MRMRPYPLILIVLFFLAAGGSVIAETDSGFGEVGMEGDWVTVDGEKFVVAGVGYEIGCRPGRIPWDREFRPDLLRADFERIKAAGFNTIRSWNPYSDAELELAAEYGLWVIQGIWYDAAADFGDPAFQKRTLSYVEEEVGRSARHPNILFYLVGNEPHADAVYAAGLDEVNAFYRKLVETARRCDPARLFSYSNCVMTDFMVPDMWDLTAQNVYPYAPYTIERTLGYRSYLEIIKRELAPGKPLVVTEFGLSVSPAGDGRGYGGNTPAEQESGVVALWDDIINAGGAGGCAFMWIDGWWKKGDENVHNEHAEEWYGLLEADTDFEGTPRPVYYALMEYNRAIRTAPHDGAAVAGGVPVEVWSPTAERVEARLDEGGWVALTKAGSWWRGGIDLSSVADGLHVLHTRMKDGRGAWCSEKQANISVVQAGDVGPGRLTVRLRDLPETWGAGVAMPVTVEVRDELGDPVAGRSVSISRFCHTQWNEYETAVRTDADGLAVADLPALDLTGIVSIAVAAEGDSPRRNTLGWKQGRQIRYGDYGHVELVELSADDPGRRGTPGEPGVTLFLGEYPDRAPRLDLLTTTPTAQPAVFHDSDGSVVIGWKVLGLTFDYDSGEGWGGGFVVFGPKRLAIEGGSKESTDLGGYSKLVVTAAIPSGLRFQLILDEASNGPPDADYGPPEVSDASEVTDDGESYGSITLEGTGARHDYLFDLTELRPRGVWGNQNGNRRIDMNAIHGVGLLWPGGQGGGAIVIHSMRLER